MKVYHGRRTEHGCAVDVEEDGECTLLDLRRDLRLHSSETNWGYGGSGPAQLALALAADVLGDDEKALDVYQRLKFKLVGGLPHEGWVLTEAQVRATIETIEQNRPRTREASRLRCDATLPAQPLPMNGPTHAFPCASPCGLMRVLPFPRFAFQA